MVFPALEKYASDVQRDCLLVWEKTMTEVFTWDAALPPRTTLCLTLAAMEVDGQLQPAFMCYGALVGSDICIKSKGKERVDEINRGAEKACVVLSSECQSLWTVLWLSLQQ